MRSAGLRMRRWRAVARLEILQLLNDRATLRIVLLVPVFQLLLFGYAVRFEPHEVPIAISREEAAPDGLLRRAIESAALFRVVGDGLPEGGARRLVEQRRALIGIEWPRSTSDVDHETQDAITVIVDDSDLETARPAVRALEMALLHQGMNLPGSMPRLPVSVIWRYNPEGRVTWSIIPALSGVISMISMLLLGALSLVRERELGTWEGLLSTPVNGLDALVGKLGPYLFLGILQTVVVIILGMYLFSVPLRGGFALICGSAALLALANLTLGFAISTLVKSQVQAIQTTVVFYLPSMLLSGFLFPFSGMPHWAQRLGELLPLTHFVRAVRGVLLRGDGAQVVAYELWPVAVFAILAAGLAISQYRRHLT